MKKLRQISLFITGLILLAGSGNAYVLAHQQGEGVKLVTDRNIYVAGENVFFRVFHFIGGRLNEEPEIIYLLLKNRHDENILSLTYRFSTGNSFGSFYLPDTLNTGIFRVYAFTDAMQRLSGFPIEPVTLIVLNRFDESLDGLSFSPSTPQADTEINGSNHFINSGHLTTELNKEVFGRREKVDLEIENTSGWVDLSVTVARHETLLPGFAFSGLALNNFDRGLAWPYCREGEELLLTGLLLNKESGEPLAGSKVLLSKPDTVINLLVAETDSAGRFAFVLPGYFFQSKVFLQSFFERASAEAKIILDDKFSIGKSGARPSPEFDILQRDFFEFLQTSVGVTKSFPVSFGPITIENVSPLQVENKPLVYSRPAHFYRLDDYEPMVDLPEIAREIIPYLRIRSQRNEFTARIMNETESFSFFNRSPMVFLNSIPVKGFNTIVDLGSADLSRIEIVSFPWRYGPLQFDGILALFSRQHEGMLQERFDPIKVVNLPEVNVAARYETPDYSQVNPRERTPDFRHTLFWEPRLVLEEGLIAHLSFFTGDLPGTYSVLINGVTAEGEKVTFFEYFRVETN